MRRHRALAHFGLLVGAVLAGLAFLPVRARAQSSDVETGPETETGRWLPLPEEDLENPEALEEDQPGFRAGALLRGTITRGRFRMRRIGVAGEGHGIASVAGFLFDERRVRPGARIEFGRGRAILAGGRVSVSRGPPLLAEAMKITRTGRRVPAPRWGGIAASPSLGASAGAIDGAAVRVLRGSLLMWSFAGFRSGSGEALGGVGLGIARGKTRAEAAFGAAGGERGATRYGSITLVRKDRLGNLSLEALRCSEGKAFLAEATARGEEVLFSARWRYLSWEPRAVAGEIAAETLGSEPRVRLTWRTWARNAAADDGLLELEAGGSPDGPAPIKVRVGAAGLGSLRDGEYPQEAYALADATVARGRGRSLGLHVLKRASAAGPGATSTTVGARLSLNTGRVGAHSVLIESTRLRRGAPAWGIAIAPSGEATLRSRSRPGMWITARGGFGTKRALLGYALERGEDSAGPRPWSGSVWIRLNSD